MDTLEEFFIWINTFQVKAVKKTGIQNSETIFSAKKFILLKKSYEML